MLATAAGGGGLRAIFHRKGPTVPRHNERAWACPCVRTASERPSPRHAAFFLIGRQKAFAESTSRTGKGTFAGIGRLSVKRQRHEIAFPRERRGHKFCFMTLSLNRPPPIAI